MPRGIASYSYSKEYTTANSKKYYDANKEKVLEYAKKYYEEHKDKAKAYQKAYREKKKAENNKDAVHVSPSPQL